MEKDGILYDFQPQMLCFQETKLKIGQTSHLKNYTGYFKTTQILQGPVEG